MPATFSTHFPRTYLYVRALLVVLNLAVLVFALLLPVLVLLVLYRLCKGRGCCDSTVMTSTRTRGSTIPNA